MTLVSELFHWKQSKARGMSFVTELCSLEKRQSQGRLFTRKLKETPGSLAGQNSEEFKHQVKSDFAPEPSSQGLFWKLSEREFISLLCGTNDATSPWYLQRRHLVMFMCKGQAVSRGMYGRRLKCDLGSRGVACVSSASNERCPALSLSERATKAVTRPHTKLLSCLQGQACSPARSWPSDPVCFHIIWKDPLAAHEISLIVQKTHFF